MNPYIFLFLHRAKNRFREFIRRPSQLIVTLVVVLMLVFIFSTGSSSVGYGSLYRDRTELYAIVFLLYSLCFIMTAKNGFSNGAAIFSMADVNLLFTSPLKEKGVLTYGLVQQLGKSLAGGFFILYQWALVNDIYGISALSMVYILIGYGATVFLGQLTAMVIYMLTCSKDSRVLKGKIIFYSLPVLFIGAVLVTAYDGGFSLKGITQALRQDFIAFFPVSGFLSFAVEATGEGAVIRGALLFIITAAVLMVTVSKINGDFYEDVLSAAQTSFSAVTARKEGKVSETAPRKIKLGKTGITGGWGASAIREKHKLENRRARVFLITPTGIMMVLLSVVYSFVFSGDILPLIVINIYTMSLSVCTGRWARELTLPYIYLIPQRATKKLINLIWGDLPTMAAESLLCFLPLVVLRISTAAQWLGLSLLRFSFGLLFIGINLLMQRFMGDTDKKVFILVVYSFMVVLLSLPSVITGVLVNMLLPLSYVTVYIIMTGVNLAFSALILYLSRGVLEAAEGNNK